PNLLSPNVAAGTNETYAGLTFDGGASTINLTANASGSTQLIATGGLIRQNQAMAGIYGAGLGAVAGANVTNVKFGGSVAGLSGGGGAPGTTTISILPYAVGGATNAAADVELLTNGSNGLRSLTTSATEYATTIADGSATFNNVRLTTAVTVNAA